MIRFDAAFEQDTPVEVVQPAKVDPFDLTPVKRSLAAYDQDIQAMEQTAKSIEVKDNSTQEKAVELGGKARQIARKIESARKAFVEQPKAFAKSVDSLAKSYKDRFSAIENGLKRKIADFARQQELERRKAEQEARRQAEEAQKKLEAEAEAAGVEAPKVEAPAQPGPPKVTRTEYGSAHQRKAWTYEVEDEQAVPREFLMVDERKVRQAVKDGIRSIPGVKIFEQNQTVFR